MRSSANILDIGSSKVVCFCGAKRDNRFELYGAGVAAHEGLRRQTFLDEPSLIAAIAESIERAQQEARRNIRSVTVGVPGTFIRNDCAKSMLTFSQPRPVTEEDIEKLIEVSLDQEEIPQGYTCIHSVPISFEYDNTVASAPPVGKPTEYLGGIIAHVYLLEEFQRLLTGILREMNVEVEQFVDATYAEGLLLVPEKEWQGDSIVVDMGYFHTDVCFLRNEAPIYRKTIPAGGAHFAKDLTYVLNIAQVDAEAIKRRHVFGLDYAGRIDGYRLSDDTVENFDYNTLQEIIEARATELSALILRTLYEAPVEIERDTKVYLCGGGLAMMRGGRDFLQSRLNLNVTMAMPPMPRLNSSNYASAYGVLDYAIERERLINGRPSIGESRFVQAIVNFFMK